MCSKFNRKKSRKVHSMPTEYYPTKYLCNIAMSYRLKNFKFETKKRTSVGAVVASSSFKHLQVVAPDEHETKMLMESITMTRKSCKTTTTTTTTTSDVIRVISPLHSLQKTTQELRTDFHNYIYGNRQRKSQMNNWFMDFYRTDRVTSWPHARIEQREWKNIAERTSLLSQISL